MGQDSKIKVIEDNNLYVQGSCEWEPEGDETIVNLNLSAIEHKKDTSMTQNQSAVNINDNYKYGGPRSLSNNNLKPGVGAFREKYTSSMMFPKRTITAMDFQTT